MARMVKSTPVGLRSFSNKDQSKWYYMVFVEFEDEGTEGLACASLFVTDTDFAVIQSRFGDPEFTLQIFRTDRGYDYVM